MVRSARVHLVLPKDALFGEEQQQAKASVVLQLRRSLMPPEQAEAIRSLVAGAVENLSPEDVTLVDADGRLNLAVPSQGAAAGDAERALEEKLVAMLEPTAGTGNVRATVNVMYDESSEEKTDEVVDPTQVAALSLHKSEQTMGRESAGGRSSGNGKQYARERRRRAVRRRQRRRRRRRCLHCYRQNGTAPARCRRMRGCRCIRRMERERRRGRRKRRGAMR